jgi:hypothetical protein
MADKCPLGEDCDLTLAYMMGAERAKDTIVVLRAENERLKAALRRISLGSQNSGTTKEDLGREARTALKGNPTTSPSAKPGSDPSP